MRSQRRFFFVSVLTTIAVILILAAIKAWQIYSAIMAHAGGGPPPVGVSTLVAQSSLWQPTFSVIGTVVSERGALVSAELTGILDEVHVRPGQEVSQGERLYSLEHAVEQAELERSQADLELANQNLSRITKLYEAKAAAKEVYDSAVATQQKSRAETARMKALLQKKVVRAPYAGTVGIRRANPGDFLHPGDPVIEIRDRSELNVDFEVTQDQFQWIKVGDAVAVIAGPHRTTATILSSDPGFNDVSRLIRIRAQLTDSITDRDRLRPGMFVSLEINQGEAQEVIFVPTSSVVYAPFGDSVFIIEKKDDTTTVRREIVRLASAVEGKVPVLSGLKPGDVIVSSGAFRLQPGAPVIVSDKQVPDEPALSEGSL
jgi:membrane fusion protein, multidrug efflux system